MNFDDGGADKNGDFAQSRFVSIINNTPAQTIYLHSIYRLFPILSTVLRGCAEWEIEGNAVVVQLITTPIGCGYNWHSTVSKHPRLGVCLNQETDGTYNEMAARVYIGPNQPLGAIISADWYNTHQTVDCTVQFEPIDNPCILAATIDCFKERHLLVYSVLEVTLNYLQCQFVYIPRPGRMSIVRSYVPYSEIAVCDNNTVAFSIPLHIETATREFQARFTLVLCDHAYQAVRHARYRLFPILSTP
jgi:hypothetical protein